MEWLIVPAVTTVLVILVFILLKRNMRDFWDWDYEILYFVLSIFLIVLVWVCIPFTYFAGYTTSYKMTNYYETVVLPNKVIEDDTTITVTGLDAGMWQSGEGISLTSYNSYLTSNRIWSKRPIIDLWVYDLPSSLKYIKVISK